MFKFQRARLQPADSESSGSGKSSGDSLGEETRAPQKTKKLMASLKDFEPESELDRNLLLGLLLRDVSKWKHPKRSQSGPPIYLSEFTER